MENLKLLSKISISFQKIEDFDNDMNSILEEIGRFMNVSRIYIFLNETKEIINNTFEWCNKNIIPQIQNLQKINSKDVESFQDIISLKGYISSNDISEMPQNIIELLIPKEIKALVAYPLIIKKQISGFIGFDECKNKRSWTPEEIEILSTLSVIISSAYEKKFCQEETMESETNFRNFFETIDDMFIVSEMNGNILNCNSSSVTKLGYTHSEFKKMNLLDLHPVAKKEEASNLLEKMILKERKFCPIPFINKSGEIFSVESRIWIGKWNKKDCIYSISKDLSKENENLQMFSKIFENNPLPMSITDMKNGKFIKVNPSFLEKSGYTEEDVYGKTIEEIELFTDIKKIKDAANRKLNGEIVRDEEICIRLKDGKYIRGLFSMENITIQGKEAFLTVIIDITDRIDYENKILEISNRDSLTNIYNRRYVYDVSKEIIEEYKRTGNEFSICIIDVDEFKLINDSYGHQIGDCVLKEFTEIIEENIRPYDVFGRFGGEEFIIIFKNSDIGMSTLTMNRILEIIRNKTFIFEGIDIKFTFSAGISVCTEVDMEKMIIDDLVKIADMRMYKAKNDGRNKIINN